MLRNIIKLTSDNQLPYSKSIAQINSVLDSNKDNNKTIDQSFEEMLNANDIVVKEITLTTIDNEWNPFTNFDEWFNKDMFELHYNTLGKIADELIMPENYPKKVQYVFKCLAIDEVIRKFPLIPYVIVEKEIEENSNFVEEQGLAQESD